MSKRASARFDIQSWDENTVEEIGDGKKIVRANVKTAWSGDVEGTGTIEYVMAYRTGGSAQFLGVHRVVGRLAGREGSFVLTESGAYGGEGAEGTWSIVDGAGTGGLACLRGGGGYVAKKGEHHAAATLDYDLA